MELYLIRHTTTNAPASTIYGWSEVDCLQENFIPEAEAIKAKLPSTITKIYSSNSLRCQRLVEYLFPTKKIEYSHQLRELHFGNWEMQTWETVNQNDLQKWMDDFVHEVVPNGESYVQLYQRVIQFFTSIEAENKNNTIALVCHAGVIRSLLCFLSNSELKDSFTNYKVPIGCVYKVELSDSVKIAML